eukprot:CAMPEP_0179444378 /NCGR_PEP_ID=MMETSP0799-20121207/27846_1 /TAXON_ID=46947 /ORGANISM="Geminigera cryophila, Strain CCMP2564" /LENGTH=144 /DNA_ID=CAMNT_0021231405 /DNA_START=39 /DNA_END=470 /DNA_ORIENTATION=-
MLAFKKRLSQMAVDEEQTKDNLYSLKDCNSMPNQLHQRPEFGAEYAPSPPPGSSLVKFRKSLLSRQDTKNAKNSGDSLFGSKKECHTINQTNWSLVLPTLDLLKEATSPTSSIKFVDQVESSRDVQQGEDVWNSRRVEDLDSMW